MRRGGVPWTKADGAPGPGPGLFPGWIVASVYAVLSVIVLLPIFSVHVLCLGDYLNHLARIHILTTVAHSPALQQYYETHWRLVPYFGMDVPVALLARFMDIYQAGRIFVAVCVVMPVAAAATLHYAVYRRVGLVPAFGFLLSYGWLLAMGFLSYVFSAGLTVMLFAGWVATQGWERWRRAALFGAAAVVLYLCHAFAFAAYGLLVGGYELGRLVRRDRRDLRAKMLDFLAAAGQALPTALFICFLQSNGTSSGSAQTDYVSVWGELAALFMPLYFPGPVWVMEFFLTLPFIALLFSRWIRLPRYVWPAVVPAALFACIMPHMLLGVLGADFRLPFLVGTVSIGMVSVAPDMDRRLAVGLLVALVSFVTIRGADAFMVLHQLDSQVADIRQVLAVMPPGRRLLVVDGDDTAPGRVVPVLVTAHLGLLATLDRDAYVPYLFTGLTAVDVKPNLRDLTSRSARPATFAQLQEGFENAAPKGPLPSFGCCGVKYWLGWQAQFDYALVVHFGNRENMAIYPLQLVAESKVADLYRVTGSRSRGPL
jgi:hypothetical protein